MRRSTLTALLGVVAGSLVVGATGVLPASAAVRPAVASPLSAVPGATWQTDNTVSALAYADGVLYAGGTFTKVRPPGTAPGAETEVAQAYLAAFRTSDMSLIAQWRPVLSGATGNGGAVQALEVSPDGRRLYVGGDFGTIDGVPRAKVAAFDLADPTAPRLLRGAQFKAAVNGRVYALSATDDALYVGGTFTSAGGAPRARVAAFGAADGAVLPWKVDLAGSWTGYPPMVNSLEAARGRVYVGGMFHTVNGATAHGVTAVDPVVGTRDAGFTTPPMLLTSYVTTLLVSGDSLYLAARDDKTGNLNRLEGVMAVSADTGEIRWGQDGRRCMGDSFALAEVAGAVWVGTHAHDCVAPALNGHPENSFPEKASGRFYASVLGHDPATGELRHFFPDTNGSLSVPGSQDNVRALATDGTRLFVAGGWLQVNGVQQQNLTTFSPRTEVPSEAPLKAPVRATTDSTGRVVVSWTTTTDRDDRMLTYTLYRNRETTPLLTRTVPSAFWDRQTMTFVDDGVAPGGKAFYRLIVSDGENGVGSGNSPTVTAALPATRYDEAVLRDAPALHWRLDDAPGSSSALDSSGRGTTGNVYGSVRFGQPTALSTGGSAAAFASSGISTRTRLAPADAYSMELWFRTTTTSGGKLIGFGDRQSGNSGLYDRQLYMTNYGQLVYGVFPSSGLVAVTTPAAYNDGRWHHVVVTQDETGIRLSVDGTAVATSPATGSQAFPGFLRIGGDNLNGWPHRPTSGAFAGELDEVAYYTRALRPDQVTAHWSLR